MNVLKKLSLILGILFIGNMVCADNPSLSIAPDNGLNYEIIFGTENQEINFLITSENDMKRELLKIDTIIVINDSDQSVKQTVDTNSLTEIEDGYLLSVPVNEYQDGTKVRITVNAQYLSNKYSYSKTGIIKSKTNEYNVINYTNNNINIFNEVVLKFGWTIANLSTSQIANLDIEADFNGIPLHITKKGNYILGTIAISKIPEESIKFYETIDTTSPEYLEELNNPKKKNQKTNEVIEEELEPNLLTLKIGNIKEPLVVQQEVNLFYKEELLSYTLNKKFIKLPLGTANAVRAFKKPDAYNCTTIFESTNPEVVSVNEKGIIMGQSVGTATIIASCGDKRAKAVVQVHNEPIFIKFNDKKKFIEVGKTRLIDLKISPETAIINYESLYLRSSDFLKAAINKETGIITAYNEGSVDITYWFDHQEVTETYEIIQAVKEIKTSLERWQRLQVGDVLPFTVKTGPVDIAEYADIKMSSSDTTVLDVSANTITAIGTGVATITVEYDGVKTSAEFEIIESDENLSDFAITAAVREISVGDTFDLRDIYFDKGKGVTFDMLTFWSNDRCVSINDGVVAGIEPGEALIKLSSQTTTQYFRLIVVD